MHKDARVAQLEPRRHGSTDAPARRGASANIATAKAVLASLLVAAPTGTVDRVQREVATTTRSTAKTETRAFSDTRATWGQPLQ